MAKGTIVIDQQRCKGCELCTTVCPQHILFMAEGQLNAKGYVPAALIDPDEQCTGCAICAVICPDVCITVFREPHPKTAHRQQNDNPKEGDTCLLNY